MLKQLKKFIREITLGESEKHDFAEDDHRLCAAALLIHIVSVDGIIDETERVRLRSILKDQYKLSEDETSELIEEARKRDLEAVDLYGFTSVLKRRLNLEERLNLVEMMWEIVYADGLVHEFEDNTVWRVTELLGIPSSDRLALRRRVADRTAQ